MADEVNFYRDRVLNGTVRVNRIYESDRVLAFERTKPSYPVHIVVIRKDEVDSILDLAPEDPLLVELFRALKSVAQQVVDEHGKCRVATNLGKYQDTKHLHWYVVAG